MFWWCVVNFILCGKKGSQPALLAAHTKQDTAIYLLSTVQTHEHHHY